MAAPTIQEWIHKMEVGVGARVLRYFMLAVLVVGLVFIYDLRAYRGFATPEAMDAAQVARNLADGQGFSTDFIRPFSLYLVQKHNVAAHPETLQTTNQVDSALIYGTHPDLANPPVYPMLLAGLFKVWAPDWQVEMRKPFWSNNGRFMRYQPEFRVAILNQMLLLAAVALTFLLTKKLFDARAAWLAALLTLGSNQLWQFSSSGLSTMLLLVILLGLAWCLVQLEELGRREDSKTGSAAGLAIAAGALVGLGMLTRYSFGALIVPTVVFLFLFGGLRRKWLPIAAVMSFMVVIVPWVVRNLMVSGTFFGTAGYAMTENAFYSGSELMQSINPNLALNSGVMPYVHRFMANLNAILQDGWLQVGGGWLTILFFAGLLLGLRNIAARRLRYFALMSLMILIITQAFGKADWSTQSSGLNSENLLVLLTPLAVIFGTIFFLTLLSQMKLPSSKVQYGVMTLLVVLACQPLAASILARPNPVSYPPYYPPEIQQVTGWMKSDDLLMSDVPWAVAWYGQRQCAWLTANAQSDFYAINDNLKTVKGIYFTTVTMDEKFLTEMARGGESSWGNFVVQIGMQNKFPTGFPLKFQKVMGSGMFLSDRQRWMTP